MSADLTGKWIVHPDLMHFDLRRPYREWPESVRAAVDAREREEKCETDLARRGEKP